MARFRSPFQLVFPGIQQLPLQLQLTRQRLNVFTDLHSFHNLPLELHAVSTPLCHSGPSCHIASIRCKSASFPRVSLSGFSPSRPDCPSAAPAALRPPLTRSAIATCDPPRSIDSTRPSTSLTATGGSASSIESPRVTTAPPDISTTRCINSRPLRLNRTTSPGR